MIPASGKNLIPSNPNDSNLYTMTISTTTNDDNNNDNNDDKTEQQ